MRTFDLTPLWRSTVGFDRLFDLIDSSLSLPGDDNYPPYNIERTGEDAYHISLALAGFTPDEVTALAFVQQVGKLGETEGHHPTRTNNAVSSSVQPTPLLAVTRPAAAFRIGGTAAGTAASIRASLRLRP